MSQLESSVVPATVQPTEIQANPDPGKMFNAAALAWEEAKQTLDQAYAVYEPLRILRQSDEPFTGDWWRYSYLPALEQVLWAIENEKALRAAYEEAEQNYRWSNQGIDDFADNFELTSEWRDRF